MGRPDWTSTQFLMLHSVCYLVEKKLKEIVKKRITWSSSNQGKRNVDLTKNYIIFSLFQIWLFIHWKHFQFLVTHEILCAEPILHLIVQLNSSSEQSLCILHLDCSSLCKLQDFFAFDVEHLHKDIFNNLSKFIVPKEYKFRTIGHADLNLLASKMFHEKNNGLNYLTRKKCCLSCFPQEYILFLWNFISHTPFNRKHDGEKKGRKTLFGCQ